MVVAVPSIRMPRMPGYPWHLLACDRSLHGLPLSPKDEKFYSVISNSIENTSELVTLTLRLHS